MSLAKQIEVPVSRSAREIEPVQISFSSLVTDPENEWAAPFSSLFSLAFHGTTSLYQAIGKTSPTHGPLSHSSGALTSSLLHPRLGKASMCFLLRRYVVLGNYEWASPVILCSAVWFTLRWSKHTCSKYTFASEKTTDVLSTDKPNTSIIVDTQDFDHARTTEWPSLLLTMPEQ